MKKTIFAVLLFLMSNPAFAITVDFDTPAVPNGQLSTFQGLQLDLGSAPWCGYGPYDTDPTRNIYFCDNVGSLPIRFTQGLNSLQSIEFYASGNATVNIYSGSQNIAPNTAISSAGTTTVNINATNLSGDIITIESSCGYCLGLTRIVYNEDGQQQPAQCSDGIDNDQDGVIDFPNDPGCDDANDDDETDAQPTAQCSDGIDNDQDGVIDFPNDPGCDDANDNDETNPSSGLAGPDNEFSYAIFFAGGDVDGDVDRIKYRVDDPATNEPGPEWDIGATDFTIEFWVYPTDPSPPSVDCAGYSWIEGNVIYDRDIWSSGGESGHGFSHTTDGITFGIDINNSATAVCGGGDLYGSWHHVALQRTFSTGLLELFVDGVLVDSAFMSPGEDVSYPDGYVSANNCGGASCINSDPFIVIGAEKHDANVNQYPAYRGYFDELRLSTVIRYPSSGGFPLPTRHTWDDNTVLLEQFDHRVNFGGNPSGPDYAVP